MRVLQDREIVDLLAACSGRQILAPGLIVGADLVWWCHALRLAGTLVARQLYLPWVTESGGVYHSRWMPVLQGEDSDRMTRLAAAMPAAARAPRLRARYLRRPRVSHLARPGPEAGGLRSHAPFVVDPERNETPDCRPRPREQPRNAIAAHPGYLQRAQRR